ncbi:MAG: DUF3108 domain-containing protein [Candidatus Krumholzibacteriia bacterium]
MTIAFDLRRPPILVRTAAALGVLVLALGACAEPVISPADAAELPAGAAPVSYGVGEQLVFSIDYGLINAGEGTLEVLGLVDFEGEVCYFIQSKATSNRFFSAFYRVRDRVVSYIDATELFSRYFHKRLREGDYRKDEEITFDQEAGVAHYADGREVETVCGVHDVLSAFYYVRTLDLEVGAVYEFPAHSSRKTYPLTVRVVGRETVEVPAGRFDCFVVEPMLEGDGLFKAEGKMTLYLTADRHKIPVLMKTKVPVGSIDASLKEYRLGQPPQPAAAPTAVSREEASAQ